LGGGGDNGNGENLANRFADRPGSLRVETSREAVELFTKGKLEPRKSTFIEGRAELKGTVAHFKPSEDEKKVRERKGRSTPSGIKGKKSVSLKPENSPRKRKKKTREKSGMGKTKNRVKPNGDVSVQKTMGGRKGTPKRARGEGGRRTDVLDGGVRKTNCFKPLHKGEAKGRGIKEGPGPGPAKAGKGGFGTP